MAIIPGFLEEFFFRGIVQSQLQGILQNGHAAILISASLFSLLHFQFYRLIPRFLFGVLFGYMFLWSNNIWYVCAAHVTNNLLGVLGSYFFGMQFLNVEYGGIKSIVFLIASIVTTGIVILRFKIIEGGNILTTDKLRT